MGSTIDPNLVYYSPLYLGVERFRRQLDLPLREQQQPAAAVLHSRPGDHADARLRRLSVSCRISRAARRRANARRFRSSVRRARSTPAQQNFACDSLIPLFPGQPNTYAFVSQARHAARARFWPTSSSTAPTSARRSLLTARYLPDVHRAIAGHAGAGHLRRPVSAARAPPARSTARRRSAARTCSKYGAIYDWVVPYGNRYDFTSYTAFTTPAFIVTYPITHPTAAAAAALHLHGTAAQQQPRGAAGPANRISFRRPSARRSTCAPTAAISSSYFPGGVRFPFEEDVATVAQQQYGAYLQDTIDMSNRWKAEAGAAPRRLQLSDSDPSRARRASIPAAEHQRLYEPHLDASYLPDIARHDSRRLRAHALDAAAEPAGRRREPRAVRGVRSDSVLRQLDRRSRRRTAGRSPISTAAATPISSTG